MNMTSFFLASRNLLRHIALLILFLSTPAVADSPVVGWVEHPDSASYSVIRNGQEVPAGISDLQSCDVVRLKDYRATVRITLFGYQRLALDSKVRGKQLQIPCEETQIWSGKMLSLARAIAGLATAPATPVIAATRLYESSPRLVVPALGNYNPKLVTGERSLFITWEGGVPPYTVALTRFGGEALVEQDNIEATSVRLPKLHLPPGRYVLTIQGHDKYGVKEDNLNVVAASQLPQLPNVLADARLSPDEHDLLYAYYLEGWGQGEWTLEALQRADAIAPSTHGATEWIHHRFLQAGK